MGRQQGKIAEDPQLKELAVTIRGHTMEDGRLGIRPIHETIRARPKSTKHMREILKTPPSGGLFRTDASDLEQEKGELRPGTCEYLVVGYTPRKPDSALLKSAPSAKKQPVVGTSQPNHNILWKHDEIPVLVVAEILSVQPASIQLWALEAPTKRVMYPLPSSAGRRLLPL